MEEKIQVPPIKSQGIKTKLISWIHDALPDDFEGRWIEPFMGTGVVGLNLAPARALLCDSNPYLVDFYSQINEGMINAAVVREYLETEGRILSEVGETHYYKIRERFNEEHNPLDFLFLSRAGFNGMIRFNKKGGYNIPFCKKPDRFAKAYVTKIVNQVEAVSKILAKKDFEFICQDFSETIKAAAPEDIIYCDPPYIGRHVEYFNGWDEEREQRLFDDLSGAKSKFILSTWHHNDYRKNEFVESHWSKFNVLTREHFYHVGGKIGNRNPMIEALITNYVPSAVRDSQLDLSI